MSLQTVLLRTTLIRTIMLHPVLLLLLLLLVDVVPVIVVNVAAQCSTSSPGPSPRLKGRSEKPLAKAAEILQESWRILSRDT